MKPQKRVADDWPPVRSVWNQQRYHVTNINDDLTIPARERPHWLLPGLNRAMINGRLPEARTEEQDTFTYRASGGMAIFVANFIPTREDG